VKFKCKKHPFLTEEIWKAAEKKQDDILNRVENFQDDLTDEAAQEMIREFHLTVEQADEIMGVV